LLELATEEMEGRGIMHYYSGHTFEPQYTSVKGNKTGGRGFVVDTVRTPTVVAILCTIQMM